MHKFGRYTITGKIAQGGMAEVYRAKYSGEGGFEKDVAVKRILPHWCNNREFITMLCDEARALVHLQHQNIVQIYELGKDGNTFYISMEYVDGVDLRKLFNNISESGSAPLPVKFTCFIVNEILKALNFAHNCADKQDHALKIIHRDISPQNILLSYNGEVKVADFGIAKGAHRSMETTVAQVKGKYAYMSPEQASGKPVDVRTDLYAVGVLLYELTTGTRLYDIPNDLLTIEQIKKSTLPEGWERNVPPEMVVIIRRSLECDPDKRYQSATEFLGDVNKFVMANEILTHGIEFSAYLKGIFKDHKKNNTLPEDIPRTRILTFSERRTSQAYWHGAGFIAVLIMGSIPLMASHALQSQPVKAITEAAKPSVSNILPSFGSLSIQTRPWGYVYIPGFVNKRETPIKDLKLKTGNYLLKIHYEPEDKWVQKNLTIANNSNTTCLASFGENPTIHCK